jgi:hypothetical protein
MNSIHLTTEWQFDRLAKYGRQITSAMRKLVERFPSDMTLESLADDIISGKNQLWLILDESENFVAFVTSEIKVSDATGKKTVMLSELAGEGGTDIVPLIEPIEQWARAIGATELTPIGRLGWRKALAKQGYDADIVLYRKDLT